MVYNLCIGFPSETWGRHAHRAITPARMGEPVVYYARMASMPAFAGERTLCSS